MITDKLPNKTVENGDWRMSVIAEPWSDRVKVWIGHKRDGFLYTVNLLENGSLQETKVNEGADIENPFMSMPIDLYYQFSELFNKAEVPVEQEATQAELKATKYHLEDMRALVLKGIDK